MSEQKAEDGNWSARKYVSCTVGLIFAWATGLVLTVAIAIVIVGFLEQRKVEERASDIAFCEQRVHQWSKKDCVLITKYSADRVRRFAELMSRMPMIADEMCSLMTELYGEPDRQRPEWTYFHDVTLADFNVYREQGGWFVGEQSYKEFVSSMFSLEGNVKSYMAFTAAEIKRENSKDAFFGGVDKQ